MTDVNFKLNSWRIITRGIGGHTVVNFRRCDFLEKLKIKESCCFKRFITASGISGNLLRFVRGQRRVSFNLRSSTRDM